jgi:sec-independent protein translocase protein TatA
MNLGPMELGIILLIALLIFGPGKLADLGSSLGRSLREFRQALREPEAAGESPATTPPSGSSPRDS